MVDRIKKKPVQTLLIIAAVFFLSQLISYTNGYEKLAWICFILMCACVFIMIAISWRKSGDKEEENGEG